MMDRGTAQSSAQHRFPTGQVTEGGLPGSQHQAETPVLRRSLGTQSSGGQAPRQEEGGVPGRAAATVTCTVSAEKRAGGGVGEAGGPDVPRSEGHGREAAEASDLAGRAQWHGASLCPWAVHIRI